MYPQQLLRVGAAKIEPVLPKRISVTSSGIGKLRRASVLLRLPRLWRVCAWLPGMKEATDPRSVSIVAGLGGRACRPYLPEKVVRYVCQARPHSGAEAHGRCRRSSLYGFPIHAVPKLLTGEVPEMGVSISCRSLRFSPKGGRFRVSFSRAMSGRRRKPVG